MVLGAAGETVCFLPDNHFGRILDIYVWYVHGYVDGCDGDGVALVGALPFFSLFVWARLTLFSLMFPVGFTVIPLHSTVPFSII